MTAQFCFISPLDVLYLRGNRMFGEAGQHAGPLMPPWPSLFAGALRSRMLADHQISFSTFSSGTTANLLVEKVLGTPGQPGSFRLIHATLGQKKAGQDLGPLFPLPADLLVFEPDEQNSPERLAALAPVARSQLSSLNSSFPGFLSHLPILNPGCEGKSSSHFQMTQAGFQRHLEGNLPDSDQVLNHADLWGIDHRLGIALDAVTRTAEEGRIYTTDVVAFKNSHSSEDTEIGFLVGVEGTEGLLPNSGMVRLGGDGRGAQLSSACNETPFKFVPPGPGFRIILATPGLFAQGWIPPGIHPEEDGNYYLKMPGMKARFASCAMPRNPVISGWDLARNAPKAAECAAPTGSVYWMEIVEGDTAPLQLLLDEGLWPLAEQDAKQGLGPAADLQRKAEGFNNVWLGVWK